MTGRAAPTPDASPRDVAVDDAQAPPRHGLVYRVGSKRKDEDRAVAGEHVTCGGERFAYFAIFDGHGGKDAADRCQATLHDQISRRAPDTTKATDALGEGLRRACWELDEDLGSAHVDAGTTATILCIGRSTATLGWVGDSTALVVDMTSPKPAWATPKHNPQNPSEVARMKAEWGARREFLLYESPDGEDQAYNEAMDAFTATYEKRLADHFRAQNLPPLRPNLIRDSMRRETLINDRCDRVNTMRRKQSFEAVTKFGKVVRVAASDESLESRPTSKKKHWPPPLLESTRVDARRRAGTASLRTGLGPGHGRHDRHEAARLELYAADVAGGRAAPRARRGRCELARAAAWYHGRRRFYVCY